MKDIDDKEFETCQKIIKKFAGKAYRRALAINSSLDYDDIVQEMNIHLIEARRSFKGNSGVKFSTYFTTGIYSSLNRKFSREERFNSEIKTMRVFDYFDEVGDSENFMGNCSTQSEASLEEKLEEYSVFQENLDKLSDKAKIAILELLEPSKALINFHENLLKRQEEYIKEGKLKSVVHKKEITLSVVMEYLEFSKEDIKMVQGEFLEHFGVKYIHKRLGQK